MSDSIKKYNELVEEGKVTPDKPSKQQSLELKELYINAEWFADIKYNKQLNIVAWNNVRESFIRKHTKK